MKIFPRRPASVRKALLVSLLSFCASFIVGFAVCAPLLAVGGYVCTVLALAVNTLLSFVVPGLFLRYYTVGGSMALSGGKASKTCLFLAAALAVICQSLVEWAAHVDWLVTQALGLTGGVSQASKLLLASVCDFSDVWHWVATLVVVALLPALCEEFFFRAGLLPLLRRATGGWRSAVVLSAVIFSALHLDPSGFLSRTVLGLILGIVFVATRSIWPSVIFHFLNNAMCVITVAVAETPLDALTAEPVSPTFFETSFSLMFTIYLLYIIPQVAKGKLKLF